MSSPTRSQGGRSSPSESAPERRGWNLALGFQEVFTAIVRLRYNRQAVSNAEAFRGQMKQALRSADQEARAGGYSAEDVKQAIFAVVAFLDESALTCRNPAFSDWARLPLQAEMFNHQLAGEVFFQELQTTLGRDDSSHVADVLEIYYLCLLLGFKGRYAAGGDLRSIMAAVQRKIQRVRGPSSALSPSAALPSDTIRLGQPDLWVRRLAIAAAVACFSALALFLTFRVLLAADAAELSASVMRFLK